MSGLGNICGASGDKWWTVFDAESAQLASREILAALPSAIEQLSEFSTEDGASRAMKSGALSTATSELREYLQRPSGSDHWPAWDKPFP
jgi:hypothetical protein